MLIVLLIITPNWKQSRGPSTRGHTNYEHSYQRMLPNNHKEQLIRNNLDEPHWCYAEREKPVSKDFMLNDYKYNDILETTK